MPKEGKKEKNGLENAFEARSRTRVVNRVAIFGDNATVIDHWQLEGGKNVRIGRG